MKINQKLTVSLITKLFLEKPVRELLDLKKKSEFPLKKEMNNMKSKKARKNVVANTLEL